MNENEMKTIHVIGHVSSDRTFFWVTVSRGTLPPIHVNSVYVSRIPEFDSVDKVTKYVNSYISELSLLIFGVPHFVNESNNLG